MPSPIVMTKEPWAKESHRQKEAWVEDQLRRAAVRQRARPALEPLIPLTHAARLLGVAIQTLRNRLHKGDLSMLEPRKVLGRWKVPVRAVEALQHGDTTTAPLTRRDHDERHPHRTRPDRRASHSG